MEKKEELCESISAKDEFEELVELGAKYLKDKLERRDQYQEPINPEDIASIRHTFLFRLLQIFEEKLHYRLNEVEELEML